MANSRLFQPLKVGKLHLASRVAMAPLTRYRASDEHVPLIPMVPEYYAQRASVPGTLLITEATLITSRNGGHANVPGIWNQAQIDAWRQVTDAVHAKKSFIYLQLWALGRVADPDTLKKDGHELTAPSAIPYTSDAVAPRELTIPEIKETIDAYAQAAKNAVAAGFDGVEIIGANGYLIDQFTQDVTNSRTDEYGGSIENRSRFGVEVAKAVSNAIGADRTGYRMSPFSTFQGMKMKDPVPQFQDLIKKLDELKLAYIHLVESRVAGNIDVEGKESLEPFLPLFSNPVLVAGGFKAQLAKTYVDEKHKDKNIIIVFGRYFLANPDLIFRIEKGIEFNDYNRDTFYNAKSTEGYTDYPFRKEFEQVQKSQAVGA